jgi:sulfonate transport system substrate-binding protein
MKPTVFAAALVALLGGLGLSAGPAAADETLRVGYLRTQGYIADFPLEGVKLPGVTLELIPLETGNDVLEALNAGRVDIGETGEVQPIFAQAGGRSAKVIAATEPHAGNIGILVKPDSPLHAVADLKGHTISFVPGTNTHYLVLRALASVGLHQQDVTPVLLGTSESLVALRQGQLDAATVTAPTLILGRHQGLRLLTNGIGYVNASTYFLAYQATIEQRGPALAAFVHALDRHLRWLHAHEAERAKWLAPKYNLPADIILEASKQLSGKLSLVGDGAFAAYNQKMADAFLAQKLIPRKLDAAQEFDGRFDHELVAS